MPYGIVREIKKFGLSTLLVFTFLTCTILMLLSFCRACEILNPLDILVFSLIASPLQRMLVFDGHILLISILSRGQQRWWIPLIVQLVGLRPSYLIISQLVRRNFSGQPLLMDWLTLMSLSQMTMWDLESWFMTLMATLCLLWKITSLWQVFIMLIEVIAISMVFVVLLSSIYPCFGLKLTL